LCIDAVFDRSGPRSSRFRRHPVSGPRRDPPPLRNCIPSSRTSVQMHVPVKCNKRDAALLEKLEEPFLSVKLHRPRRWLPRAVSSPSAGGGYIVKRWCINTIFRCPLSWRRLQQLLSLPYCRPPHRRLTRGILHRRIVPTTELTPKEATFPSTSHTGTALHVNRTGTAEGFVEVSAELLHLRTVLPYACSGGGT